MNDLHASCPPRFGKLTHFMMATTPALSRQVSVLGGRKEALRSDEGYVELTLHPCSWQPQRQSFPCSSVRCSI